MTTYSGVDIGNKNLKIAVANGDGISHAVTVQLPDNIVRDGRILAPDAMSDCLKDAFRKNHIRQKNCAVILPSSAVYVRRYSSPPLMPEHVRLNLPYEFRDYITTDKDKYYYDYTVLSVNCDEENLPISFDIFASATLKDTIHSYQTIFRRAGLRLKIAVPAESAFRNIILNHIRAVPEDADKEYCFIDLGHNSTRVFMYEGASHNSTRIIDLGGAHIDSVISEKLDVDIFVANSYKFTNHDNAQTLEESAAIYNRIAVEIMRTVNFYGYNNAQTKLHDAYILGGGALIPAFVDAVTTNLLNSNLNITTRDIRELLPNIQRDQENIAECCAAAGITMQKSK